MYTVLVSTIAEGIEKAEKILHEKIDRRSVFFLSGGSSPKPLYQSLSLGKKIHPAAIALIDERYGKPMHEKSNEKMIRRTGLLNYFVAEHIPFHGILQNDLSCEDTAIQYDETVRKLFFNIPRSVAVVGLGNDGHTAGIAPNRDDFTNPLFQNISLLAGDFIDEKGSFGERITLTFSGLAMIDYFILWVFGDDKREALQKIFTPGSLQEVPGRFYTQPEISEKVTLITDLRI